MKKTYIQPAIKTVCVRTGRMMTGSDPDASASVGGPANNSDILGKEDYDEGFDW